MKSGPKSNTWTFSYFCVIIVFMYREVTGAWIGERLGHPIDREANRDYQAEQLERFFELSGLYDTFSSERTPQERFDDFFSLDNEQLSGYLARVNGVLRNLPEGIRGFADKFQYLGGTETEKIAVEFVPCFFEDKETMLHELFDTARKVKSPQEAATLLGFGINIVHPYGDGNGRIARLVYTSILHGFNRYDDKLKLLAGDTGDKLLDLSGSFYVSPVFNLLKMDSPSFITTHSNGIVRDIQPTCTPALFDGSKPPPFSEHDLMHNEEVKRRGLLFTLILEKNMGEFVAAGMKRDANQGKLDVAKDRIIRSLNDKDYFLIDRYIAEASDGDIDRALGLVQRMARVFTKRFFREFTVAHNQQQTIALYTEEFGIMSLRFAEFGSHIAEKVVTPAELPEQHK